MKKIIFLIAFIVPTYLFAQKNIVQLNLSSLVVKNFYGQYERQLTKHSSIIAGIRFQPKGKLPLPSLWEEYTNTSSVDFTGAQVGNFAFTPEFRYYLGKNLKGFYVAPYLRYSNLDMSVPVKFSAPGFGEQKADFNGKINIFAGGVMLGTRFALVKKLYLDIWLVGAHIGTMTGDLNFVRPLPLSPSEQNALESELNNISNNVPFTKIEYDVNSNGATAKTKGAGAGIRGLGLAIGFRF